MQLLINKGANLSHQSRSSSTPVMAAVGWGGQYDIAVTLLEAGANYKIYKPRSTSRLVHILLMDERRSNAWTPGQQADYLQLLKWLKDHGESIEEAQADLNRWKSWSHTSGEFRRKMNAEVAERKIREAREKAASVKKNAAESASP